MMDMRVAAYAVITDDDGRVLLSHWLASKHSAWTMPGGGLEPGEDPYDAVRREVTEETGYTIDVDDLLGINSSVIAGAVRIGNPGTDLHALRIVYRAHITGGELAFEVDGSTDMAGWFTVEEIAALPRVKLIETALRMAGIELP